MKKTWHVLLHNRWYLGISTGLFVVGVLLGALFTEQIQEMVKAGLEHLRELAEQAQEKEDPLYMSQLIFWNNLRAVVFMLVLGSLFGIFTMIMLLINGMMIGVVFSLAGGQMTVSLFDMIVFGLLPHGIFELLAIFIASGFGIKLGKVLLLPHAGKTRWESYGAVWREIVQISWVLLLLLVVAAAVEGLVTPQLLEAFAR